MDGDADALLRRGREIAADVFSPVRVASTVLVAGAAIGMALSHEGDDAETLLRRADEVMYAAKRTGERIAVRLDSRMTTR